MKDWQTVQRQVVLDHPVLRVERNQRRQGDLAGEFITLHSSEWVNIVPVTPQGEVVLIRQWRHGSQAVAIEIPGGLVDPGETPEQAAARELAEETGYQAPRLLHLGKVNPNPALFDNACHTFLALDAEPAGPAQLESHEDIEVFTVHQDKLPAMVASGEIDHCIVVSALALFWLHNGEVLAGGPDLL